MNLGKPIAALQYDHWSMNLSLKKITNEEFTRLGGLDLVRGKEHKIKFSTGEHLHEPIQHKFFIGN